MNLYIITKHPCCGKFLGHVVESDGKPVDMFYFFVRCGVCNARLTSLVKGVVTLVRVTPDGVWPLELMRKLPPLDESIDTTTPRELETV